MLTRKLTRRITQALTWKATEPGNGGAASFDPASQFGSGEAGVLFYIPDDLSGLYQDAGTTPCTAAGQTVARWNDFSGHGKHLTLSNAVLRKHANGKWYVEGNGTSTVGTTASVDLSGTDKLTLQIAALRTTTTGTVVSFGNVTADSGSFDFGFYTDGLLCYRMGSGSFGARGTPPVTPGQPVVSTYIIDFAGSSHSTECPVVRVDGATPTISDYGSGDSGGGNFGNRAVTVSGGLGTLSGGIFAIVVRGVASAQSEYEQMETFLAGRSGASLPFEPSVGFVDTANPILRSTYEETSPFARSVFTTSATSITFDAWCSAYADFPSFCEIGVAVDGVFQSVPMTANGHNTKTITLPSGTKTVEFVNGLQSRPNNAVPPIGSWLLGISSSNAVMTQANPSQKARAVVFYGDSITVGANASSPCGEGYPMLLRASEAYSVAVEGYGYRTLSVDASSPSARTAFVAKLEEYAPTDIWIAIGTNDFGLSTWGATDFGVAYGAVLDAIHSSMPSVAIYAQTPFTRSGAGTNSFGNTLADYRSAIVTACSTRPWATLVDGTALVTLGQLDDGVHPTTAGHAAIAANIAAILEA